MSGEVKSEHEPWQDKLLKEAQKIVEIGWGEIVFTVTQASGETKIVIKTGRWDKISVKKT